MSGWWSGNPTGIKFAEIDVLCAALGCTVADLMIAEPGNAPRLNDATTPEQAASGQTAVVTPHARRGRSLPPR